MQPMTAPPLSGWRLWLADSKTILRGNWRRYLLAALIIAAVNGVVVLLDYGGKKTPEPTATIFSLSSWTLSVLSWFIFIGFEQMFIEAGRGIRPNLRHLFTVLRRYFALFWAGILLMLIFLAGSVLLIVPGFIFMVAFIFTSNLIYDRDLRVNEALAFSAKMTRGRRWEIFCLYVCMFAIIAAAFLVVFIPAAFLLNDTKTAAAVAAMLFLPVGIYLYLRMTAIFAAMYNDLLQRALATDL